MLIGTRRSALALAQAHWVAGRLRAGGAERVELVELTTAGDRGERTSDKARWVSELELALHEGHIDVAVHSAKDVPAELADGTELAAITEREDPRDAICGAASLTELAAGARVGTSSLRRAAQLHGLRPDLEIVALRGNVDTRLRKLVDGQADALILAAAGLNRLGRAAEIGGVLDELVPAAGQGALALQVRSADAATRATVAALADADSQSCVLAERELTRALGASCQTAVGAHARSSGAQVELRGWVGLLDGSEWISDSVVAAAGEVGALVAQRMLALGAAELMARVEAAA
jgi:hydroxymethylbilane synthase